MRPPREDTVPWYKQFWPWFLIALPLSVVIAAIITINIAIQTDDGLVTDDYYKEGLAIHKDADSAAKAAALGIAGEVTFDSDTGALALALDQPLTNGAGLLVLKVIHPTRPDQDQQQQLSPLGNGRYAGRLDPLGPAHWKLQLRPEDESWRIEGRLVLPGSNSTRLD